MEFREVETMSQRRVAQVLVDELLEGSVRNSRGQRHVDACNLRRCIVEGVDSAESIRVRRRVSGRDEGEIQVVGEVGPDSAQASLAETIMVLKPRGDELQE